MLNKIRSWYGRYWWSTPLTIFVVWRIILEIVGRTALLSHGGVIIPWKNNPYPPLWVRWDSGWYDSIIRNGYSLRKTGVMSNVTFFPLFPLLWKLTENITPLQGFAAALWLNNLLSLFGFTFFYRWIEKTWNKTIALKSLLALALFPTSFFLISAYSEASLFLLVTLALLLSSRQQWLAAAGIAALASAARPTGIFLWPLLFWLWWSRYKNTTKPTGEFIALLCLPPLGIALFSLHLFFQTGHALAWLSGQSAAGRGLVSPLNLLGAYAKNILTQGRDWLRHAAEMAALIFVLLLLPTLKKINPAYAFYALLNLLPSLFSNTLTSIQRFVLIIVPLFLAVAFQKKSVYLFYCVITATLLCYSISRFVIFQWAG